MGFRVSHDVPRVPILKRIYGARKDIPRMYEILFLHPLARRKEELEM